MNSGNVVHPDAFPAPSEESVWSRRGTWASIVFGGIVGFSITLILATFGAATGLVVGAASAHSKEQLMATPEAPAQDEVDSVVTAEGTATGAGIGSAVFLILTGLISGLVGGWVAGRISPVFKSDFGILGLATWAVGMLIMFALVSFGASGMLGGFGAAALEYASQSGVGSRRVDGEAGRAALTGATLAIWGFFLAQFIGLGATILGAKKGLDRRVKLYPRTMPRTTTP